MDSVLLFFGGDKNDGVRHHLFDWGNAKIEKKSENQKKYNFYYLIKHQTA